MNSVEVSKSSETDCTPMEGIWGTQMANPAGSTGRFKKFVYIALTSVVSRSVDSKIDCRTMWPLLRLDIRFIGWIQFAGCRARSLCHDVHPGGQPGRVGCAVEQVLVESGDELSLRGMGRQVFGGFQHIGDDSFFAHAVFHLRNPKLSTDRIGRAMQIGLIVTVDLHSAMFSRCPDQGCHVQRSGEPVASRLA